MTRAVAVLLTAALVAAGCGGGGGKEQAAPKRPTGPPKASLQLSIAETATALADPERGEVGVWAMLRHLGVGVRTNSGAWRLRGAVDEVFVFDTQIPGMADAARGKPYPFARFAERLGKIDKRITVGKLVDAIKAGAYGQLPLTNLLNAQKLHVTTTSRITPLQEWLLTLDAFAPGGEVEFGATNDDDARLTATSGGPDPGWGGASGSGGLPALADPVALLHLQQMALGMQFTLAPGSAALTTGAGGPGDGESFTARLAIASVGAKVFDDGSVIVPTQVGPVSGVPVQVSLPGPLNAHGVSKAGGAIFAGQPLVTDGAGSVAVDYQAGEDPGKPTDPEVIDGGAVTARVEVLGVMQQAYALPAWAIAYFTGFPPRTTFAAATVSWHEAKPVATNRFADGTWVGSATIEGDISTGGVSYTASGPARFTLVVEGGHVTDGSLTFSYEGEVVVGGEAYPAGGSGTWALSGTATNVVASGSVEAHAKVYGRSFSADSPGSGEFGPEMGTCDRVTGDLAVHARQRQQAAGFSTTVTGPFVATRTAGSC